MVAFFFLVVGRNRGKFATVHIATAVKTKQQKKGEKMKKREKDF